MYRFRGLNAPHLVNFEPQNYKSGPEIVKKMTHFKLPGAASELPIVPAQSQATWELTDGAWELRMRPQLVN